MYHRHPLFALLISVVSKVRITGFIHTTLTRVILSGDVHVSGHCLPFITSRLLVYSVIVIRVSHVFKKAWILLHNFKRFQKPTQSAFTTLPD